MKKLAGPKIISQKEVRLLALKSQGLLNPDLGKTKTATLKTIEHLGYIQIDTLSVVARAHHHTLWSRLPNYSENQLNGMLEKDKTIFEYWSHAASYLPMSEYRFSLPRKKSYAEGKSHWFTQDKKLKKYVLDRIKAEGPLQSKDFEHKRSGPGNWYEWKPAKKALEQLFMEGKLMVAKRQGFQKVYDLAENVLPGNIDTSMPSEKECLENLIRNTIRANGIIEEKEIAYLRSNLKTPIKKALTHLLQEGELMEVKVEGMGETLFVTSAEQMRASSKIKDQANIHFLSPFDNAVIQRKRLERIFNFNYTIECYVPEAKRVFGYFCLPILYGDKFVGRFDPKADRDSKIFHVKSIYFEEGFKPDELFNQAFLEKLQAFAIFNGCESIQIGQADKLWRKEINRLILLQQYLFVQANIK